MINYVVGHTVIVLSSFIIINKEIIIFSGFTNFDLLGDFGQIEWLGNFRIVLIYNLVFMIATALCLGTKVTASVRREMYRR